MPRYAPAGASNALSPTLPKPPSMGRLVRAHDFVAGDGRAFWFVYPVAREGSAKIEKFRAWICAEAEAECKAGADYIRRAIVQGGTARA